MHEDNFPKKFRAGSQEDKVLDRVREVILEIEQAVTLQAIGNLKKMSGTSHCFRIRVGDYRVGVMVEEDTIEFVRCLNRREIYRYFP